MKSYTKIRNSVPDEFYEYLNSHLSSSYSDDEKQIIRLVFTLRLFRYNTTVFSTGRHSPRNRI